MVTPVIEKKIEEIVSDASKPEDTQSGTVIEPEENKKTAEEITPSQEEVKTDSEESTITSDTVSI